MQRQTEQRLAAEALEPINRRTVPQADGTMAVDGAGYTSTAALAFRTDNGSPTETRAARLGRWSSELIQFLPLLVFVNTGRLGLDCQERFLIVDTPARGCADSEGTEGLVWGVRP